MQVEYFNGATLYRGDCREVLQSIADKSVHLVLTDPPYGHNNARGDLASVIHNAIGEGYRVEGREYKTRMTPIANDGPDEMRQVVDAMLHEAARILTRPGTCIIHCAGGGPATTLAWAIQRMDAYGLEFFHSCVWDKLNGFGWRYKRYHEHILIGHPRGSRPLWSGLSDPLPNVFRMATRPNQHQERVHPNEKPEKLLEPFVLAHTLPGQVVVDPFMGSATTGVVAVRMDREFIGCELDSKHFDAACKRMDSATRQAALLPYRYCVQDAYEQVDALDQLTP